MTRPQSAPIFLSGPMGSGKSTVGRLVAERLGVPFVDLDARIEAEQGATVRAIFRDRGEPAFRAIERDTAARVASEPGAHVVSLGGAAAGSGSVQGGLPESAVSQRLRADHDRDHRRAGILLRRGLSSAVSRLGAARLLRPGRNRAELPGGSRREGGRLAN